MKRQSLIILAVVALSLSAAVRADHNSRFGDNTGRTPGGVHDDRIWSNTHSSANRNAMGQARFQSQSRGAISQYRQGGRPATVTPGARR